MKIYLFGEKHSIKAINDQIKRIRRIEGDKLLLREGFFYNEENAEKLIDRLGKNRISLISLITGKGLEEIIKELKKSEKKLFRRKDEGYYEYNGVKRMLELESKSKVKGLNVEVDVILAPIAFVEIIRIINVVESMDYKRYKKLNFEDLYIKVMEYMIKENKRRIDEVDEGNSETRIIGRMEKKIARNGIEILEELKKFKESKSMMNDLKDMIEIFRYQSKIRKTFNPVAGFFNLMLRLIKDKTLKKSFLKSIELYRSVIFAELIFKEIEKSNDLDINLIPSMGTKHIPYVSEKIKEKEYEYFYEQYE